MSVLAIARPAAFVLTRDRARTKAFYEETLQLRLIEENQFVCVFEMNGAPLRLTTVRDHTPSPHPILGWEVEDIAAAVRALKARGVAFQIHEGFGQDDLGVWTSPDGAKKLAFFADPEGNNLLLAQNTPPSLKPD